MEDGFCALKIENRNIEPLHVITLVGTCMSITSLFCKFLIYSCIKSLRAIPGKMAMNYIVALGVAQILLQSNDDLVSHLKLCKAIGAAQHYFWLSTLTWLYCRSYRMKKTFNCNHFMKLQLRLLPYITYGW